ncbi:hypothetical protein AGMMS50239_04300 [Bacteroidia bacterium]|nr:hypothetical protein AGMMS50239_04300 [Bacteroidia bacterium]
MKIKINLLITGIVFALVCCTEDKHEPLGSGSDTAPGMVRNVQVENIPGGAVFTYDMPDDVDIQYVKAVYVSNNVQKEARASAYVNTIKIEGFGDTNERTVKLYAVNRKEKISEPVERSIQPLTPPIRLVQESLQPDVDFGGFVISFQNETKTDLAIIALARDSATQNFVEYDAFYTSMEEGKFSVRGLPDKPNDFGMYIVDRWNNYSDTIFFTLTPWREDYLDKTLFLYKTVQGDVGFNYYNGTPQKAWNNNVSNGDYAHTNFPEEFPHRLTIDLGVDVKLSRFKFWQRPGADVLYQHGAPKVYRIYGRQDDPGAGNIDNIFEGWTLLMDCYSVKPSGLPLGQNSGEDEEYQALGEEFSFPRVDLPIVRYIRFEMLESWSGMKCSTIGEVTFWGEIQ